MMITANTEIRILAAQPSEGAGFGFQFPAFGQWWIFTPAFSPGEFLGGCQKQLLSLLTAGP